jgi:hypothetical protein
MIPDLATLIVTPHSLHHSTNTSNLLIRPDASEATKHVSAANNSQGMISSPHSMAQFSFFSFFTTPLMYRENS